MPTILIKRSNTASDVPTAGQLSEGELAINTNPADRRLWSKDSGGTVFEITDHDTLTNYVANEHIDWTSASQNLSTSGTIAGVNVTSGADPGHTHGAGSVPNHDSLTGFVANEHIDWTTASQDLQTSGRISAIRSSTALLVTGRFQNTNDAGGSELQSIGSSQGDGYIYVGQSATYGGGVAYRGDGTSPKAMTGAGTDRVTYFRRNNNVDEEVFSYSYSANDIRFRGNVDCQSGLDVTGNITVTGTVDGIDIATDVAANTAKVTNATHTGDVTGSGALTIAASAISGKTLVTAVSGDMVLLWDATDSTLKRANVSDFLGGGVAFNDLTAKTSGTGNYQTTGDFIADNFEATGVGPNTTPGTDDAYFGGYGVLGDRANPVYVSNVTGAVALNHGGVHGTNTKLATTSTGIDVTGNIVVSGTVDGIDIATDVAANTAKVTNATHTGQVTGSGALTVHVSAITGQTDIGANLVGTDEILVSDAGALRRADISRFNNYFNGALNFTNNAGTVTSVSAGNGMSFTTITGTGSVTMGTPGTLSGSTTNGVTSTSHTHAITTSGTGAIMAVSGATLTGQLNCADQVVDRTRLKDYAIESDSEVVSANAVTLTYSDGPAFEVDLEAATGTVTITISGGPPTGTYGEIIVKVQQDTTASRTITWAGGTFEWPGGTAPTMTAAADAIDIYHFSTWNGGTTWWGSVIQDMK